ncbi:MAG TPA: hypothetical protein VKS81_05335 [Bacteroidota bacterium]|nr:hypothetical protein [Bacteroidota bacterium]
MVRDCFRVVAILSRNPAGDLERTHAPLEIAEDAEVTMIPTTMGIIVVAAELLEGDGAYLTNLLKEFIPMS